MWTVISEKLTDILKNIEGVGLVLSYMPVISTVSDLLALDIVDGNKQVNFWIVERQAFRINRENTNTCTQEWIHTFRISGWKSTTGRNSSYVDFQNLVENIMEAFSANITLGLPNSTMALSPSVNRIDVSWVGDYMCNFVDISMPVRELRTVNYV